MLSLLDHPAVQSLVLPVVVCAVLVLVLRRSPLAAAALGAAVLAGAVATLGLGPWPPRSGLHKLPWLLAAALAAGVALDLVRASRALRLATAPVLLVLALGWLAAPQLRGPGPAVLAGLAALLLGGTAIVAHLGWRETPATRPAALLGVAAVGLAGVAFQAGSLAIAQLAGALGAAAGAYGLFALLAPGTRFASAGTLGGGGALVLLTALTGLLTDVTPLALVLLAVVFVAGAASARIARPQPGGVAETALIVALAAVPAVGAVAAAMWLQPVDSPYYR
jgi:hypothetical protein